MSTIPQMFRGSDLKADVDKLNEYIATNRAIQEMMRSDFPVPETNMKEYDSALRTVQGNVVKALNAHYLGVSREVYYIHDVEYVKATHNSEGYMRYTGYNGVDMHHGYIERKRFIGDGYMVNGIKWRHFLKNPDDYVYLIWHEDGRPRHKLHTIADANLISDHWYRRNIRAEIKVAQKCNQLVEDVFYKNAVFSCPHCGYEVRLCFNGGFILVDLCHGCGKAFIIKPRAEALGFAVDEDVQPERASSSRKRWDHIEIDARK